ncbi:SNF2 family N-terminal domain-containing protein [Trametes punicea]|nr:SNF2 family N-terminal domain-containing protein [Trametes punicea]
MSLGPDAAAARVSRVDFVRAALEQLRFKKFQKAQSASSSHSVSPAPPSWANGDSAVAAPPAQSRDATATSRYFPPTPSSSGTVLVPSSSPTRPDPSGTLGGSLNAWQLFDDEVPGLTRSDPQVRPPSPSADPLTMPSGFRPPPSVSNASSTRPSSANSRKVSDTEDMEEGDRPRKRLNMGPTASKDPIDFITPSSPEVRKPGQGLPGPDTSLSSLSSDDSLLDTKSFVNGTACPVAVRGYQPQPQPQRKPSSSSSARASEDAGRFTRFRLTQIEHDTDVVRAAWIEAAGDVPKASALLNDPTWKPKAKTPPPKEQEPNAETGRVKEMVEATKAQRLAAKEKGKKSMIYKNRVMDGKPTSAAGPSTPPSASKAIPLVVESPLSPEVAKPRAKRLKRKVVDSDSEPNFEESDRESPRGSRGTVSDEQRALDYFNETSAEGLQELTGCTPEQAKKIIELRPYKSVEDLNTKLGQGKKKAGPAGISPRMFEDSAAIFEGYGRVDSILEDCEGIGAELRKEIASWTKAKSKGKARDTDANSRDSSASAEDGAISLTHLELPEHKPKYFMTSQPSLLKPGVVLKEYQMIGVNWLSLLYQKGLSCILADEMGLGKTVQVISFFAHLKERGREGPHLIVVPSSTLENWCREFQKFAGDNIVVETYYADKNDRPKLRDMLNNTVATRKSGGWNVLITTYNLAQGDDHDRKFFRRIEWDTCVFDEGHVLKNFQSQRYQALLKYKSRWRLLLTGTPLQNNLQELVSLMNFILPDQFAEDLDSLRAVFKTKGDSKVTLLAQQRVSRAKKMMTPFVLRRRKDQVLQDLPKKTERIEWCEMTQLQKSIYNEALQRSRKTIFDLEKDGTETPDVPSAGGRGKAPKKKTRANGRTKDKMYLENSSNVLMDLRKAASHPMLFRRRYTDETLNSIAKLLLKEPDFKKRGAIFEYVKEDMEVMTDAELQAFCATYKSLRRFLQDEECYMQAGKIKVLLKLLDQYKKEGRRILIFSQFTQILDIIQRVLDIRKIKYLVLTGSTPVDVRQTLVDEFTEDESIPVFLLSTKAGGMGINLTAASVVIMFDQDFNPHNDKQAQDRAYRIGQKRDVEVVKLITKGSIEEDMLALGMTKLALDEAVAGEDAEERVETEMKLSLMNAVRRKLVTDEDVEMTESRDSNEEAAPKD